MAENHSARRRTGRDDGPESTITAKALRNTLVVGFYAGVIWGLARWLATGLNFTEVTQAYLLDPFLPNRALGSGWWQFAGWLAFIAMSIVAAIVYWLVLGTLRGPWPGLAFGAAWWGIFYALLGPMIGAVQPLRTVGWLSIVTDLCLYLVWGLFIGYSIAFELHDESEREPANQAPQGSPQPSA